MAVKVFIIKWSTIVRVSVVLRRTVWDDIDWRFDNLSGSHLQSQVIFVTCVDTIRTPVIDVIGWEDETVIGAFQSVCRSKVYTCIVEYRIYSCISRPFTTKKSAQKIALDLYTSHTQRPDQAVREISITTAWSVLGKPVIIVVDFHQFSAHSSSTKKCEIINVKWFKRRSTGDYSYCVFWSV